MRHNPSVEQERIIAEKKSLVVTAKPGSGKTFTVVEKIKAISEKLLDYQGVIGISFTKKATQELIERCNRRNVPKKQSFFGTIDMFYISQIVYPFSQHVTKSKVEFEIVDNIRSYDEYEELIELKNNMNSDLEKLLIKSLKDGLIFLEISGEIAMYIMRKVPECINYLKARFTHIFIDEYQDCGKIQHKIFTKIVNAGIIGVAVGDLDQAIYGFADRSSEYLIKLMKNESFINYEITKNHRCHESISAYSLKMMGVNIEYEDEKRVFKVFVDRNEKKMIQAIDKYLPGIKKKYGIEKNNEIAILCRTKDSGERTKKILRTKSKLLEDVKFTNVNTYWARLFNDIIWNYFNKEIYPIDFVSRYIDEETQNKMFLKGIKLITEIFQCTLEKLSDCNSKFIEFAMLVYPEQRNNEAIEILKDLLPDKYELMKYKGAEDNEVNILTIHKSKGLEFKIVIHLDLYKYIFPRNGETYDDYIQSRNLHYVAITRAKEACYLMQCRERYRHKRRDYINALESPFLEIEGLKELRRNVKWRI